MTHAAPAGSFNSIPSRFFRWSTTMGIIIGMVAGASIQSPISGSRHVQAKDPKVGNSDVIDQSSSAAARARGEINFDDLKFPIEKDAPFNDALLTDEVKELDGRKVKLRGYILPAMVFKNTGIKRFVLVRDNQECCFGPGAALFDCVIVDMVPGETTDFSTRPIEVEGKFKIDTKSYAHPDGKGPNGTTHFAIFHIDGLKVR